MYAYGGTREILHQKRCLCDNGPDATQDKVGTCIRAS